MACSPNKASLSTGLGEDDLGALHNALFPARKRYKSLGLQFGVKKSEIECIETQQTDLGDRLLEVLSVRVKKTEILTWNDVDKALRSHSVGESRLADEICSKVNGYESSADQEQIQFVNGDNTDRVTYNSSPERDVKNIENKRLLAIFNQFFGKLCCAIKDAVEIAAQLQEKGLISQSQMKDMVMSSESQQAKTVRLVGTVEEIIRSQPNHLSVIIEVLLENDRLQVRTVGEEMLRRTGNTKFIECTCSY